MENKKANGLIQTIAKTIFFLILIVGIVLATMYRFHVFEKGEERFNVVTSLEDVIDISELSTANFTYNGIAQAYKDEEKTKVNCNIRYEAEVKAGIDMSKVIFETDEEAKTVKVKLPQIKLNSFIDGDSSISFIPSDANIDLKEAIDICEKDALDEASSSEELLSAAEENLKSTIEALLLPILKEKEYTIIWG